MARLDKGKAVSPVRTASRRVGGSNDRRIEIALSYKLVDAYETRTKESFAMLVLDAPVLLALSALISSVSTLIWSIRRKR